MAIKIVIECEGGLVRNVRSSSEDIEVVMVDWDEADPDCQDADEFIQSSLADGTLVETDGRYEINQAIYPHIVW